MFMLFVICLMLGYLLGSLNASIIFSKIKGSDIRSKGSKNAGLTNALRVFGKKAAVVVFLGDLLKAVVAVLLARALANLWFAESVEIVHYAKYLAGLGVVLGHNFPLYFKFKGGKGILASWGVIMVLDWRIAIILIVIFLLVVLITRYVSLASIICSISYPVFAIVLNLSNITVVARYHILLAIIMAALAVYRHKANIGRLRVGTESKLGAKKDKKE